MDNNKLQKVRRRVPLIHTNSNACQFQNEDVHRSSIQSFFIAALQKVCTFVPYLFESNSPCSTIFPFGSLLELCTTLLCATFFTTMLSLKLTDA